MSAADRWARQRDGRDLFSLGQSAYCEGDFEEAMTCFQRASDQGHGRSSYWMARLYWRGQGVRRNIRMAEILLQQATAKKDPLAGRVLRFLAWSRRKRR
jgi:TPR repeat protein